MIEIEEDDCKCCCGCELGDFEDEDICKLDDEDLKHLSTYHHPFRKPECLIKK